jgi:hypothetical protein
MKSGIPDAWCVYDITAGDFRGLLEALRSGKASPEDCALAADIIEGKVKRPRHRPKHPKTWEESLRPAKRVRELERQGWGKRTAAVAQVAAEFGISKTAVQASLSEWEPTLDGWDRRDAIIEYMLREPNLAAYSSMSVAEYISKKVLT